MSGKKKELDVELSPATIALLDKYRRSQGISRREALHRILKHQIRSGSLAKAIKEGT